MNFKTSEIIEKRAKSFTAIIEKNKAEFDKLFLLGDKAKKLIELVTEEREKKYGKNYLPNINELEKYIIPAIYRYYGLPVPRRTSVILEY